MYSNIHSIVIHAASITVGARHSPKVDLFQMSLSSGIISRFLSTSQILLRKKPGRTKTDWMKAERVAFGRVVLYNKRHLPVHNKMLFRPFERKTKGYEDIPIHKYGTRGTGVRHETHWEHIPETIPELVVPDLEGFKLKPYVSYRTKEIYQEELQSKDLFHAVYGKKILRDFKEGKLGEDGNPAEPSENENQTRDEAWVKARKTGSDIPLGGVPKTKMWDVRWSHK